MSQQNKKRNKNLIIISSWDDGKIEDLQIIELLKKYQLSGIFFLSNVGLELSIKQIKEISKDFEIGGHTVSHPPDLKLLSERQLREEIKVNKVFLEEIIGKELKWFCYPKGRYNQLAIDILKECGYKYARTTLVGNTDFSKDDYRITTSVHVYPHRKEYEGQNWLDYAKKQFDIAKEKKGVFHVWGHGWEVERYSLWKELEELFIYINKNK